MKTVDNKIIIQNNKLNKSGIRFTEKSQNTVELIIGSKSGTEYYKALYIDVS